MKMLEIMLLKVWHEGGKEAQKVLDFIESEEREWRKPDVIALEMSYRTIRESLSLENQWKNYFLKREWKDVELQREMKAFFVTAPAGMSDWVVSLWVGLIKKKIMI